MDGSNSLRIPPLSASQKVVSYSLVAQFQWPCSLKAWVCGCSVGWDCGFESHPGACMSLSYERCVLSGTGLCIGSIIHLEKSYQL